MEVKDYIKQIREAIESYERSIMAIIAFDSAIRWDDKTRCFPSNTYMLPGRRLKKLINLDECVTPDVAIQINNKYGIIAEVKLTASNVQDFQNAYNQLKNYDQTLIGWITNNEKIETHDVSLLIDVFRKNDAKEYFENKEFEKSFSIVACARVSQAKEFFLIEKYFGNFSDEKIDQKLSNPVPIPIEPFINLISRIKFYDARPPVEYVMNILWMHVFSEIKESYKESRNIIVSCKELTEILREKYAFKQIDSKQPKIPKTEWVAEAIDVFKKIDFAKRDINNYGRYSIKYYHFRSKEDMLEVFLKKHFEFKKKHKEIEFESTQLELKFDLTE